jgi:hypothetical protein
MQLAGGIALVTVALGQILFSWYCSAASPFVWNDRHARWITNPRAVAPETVVAAPGVDHPVVFSRDFRLDGEPPAGPLALKALGEVTLEVNGRAVPLPGGQRACLKTPCTAAISALLRPGDNTLRARVTNHVGPALLYAHAHHEGPGSPIDIATDERWRTSANDETPRAAILADDTRPYPAALETTAPLDALRARAGLLAAVFCLAALGSVATGRLLPAAAGAHLPLVALVALTAFWIHLFVTRFVHIPLEVGYDATAHIAYVRHLVEHRALPLPTDGFSMYHPPLFYVAAATLVTLLDPGSTGQIAPWVLKLPTFFCGIGIVWITYALGRWFFGPSHPATTFAILSAGLLPLNVYMAAYVSNEPLLALLTGAALVAAARVLRAPAPTAVALLAIVLGLLLMTKYTSLTLLPVVVGIVALKLSLDAGLRRAVLIVGGILAGALLLGGWVYLRNWLHTGDPLFWNLEHPSGVTYWQPPGFRTLDFYLGFGEALRHPYFSGFHSLWDGLYSSWWGEGLPPIERGLADRGERWNYDVMSLGYLLALPATLIVGIGVVECARRSLVGPDLARRWLASLVLAIILVVLVSVLLVTARYPFWGAVRSAYVLCLVVPVAVCAGLGLATVDRWLCRPRLRAARAVFHGWFVTFSFVLVWAQAG